MADLLDGASWTIVRTAPGAAASPSALAGLDRLPALVPGTAASALRAAGLAATEDLDEQDWWWETSLPGVEGAVLRLGGLATVAEVWVDELCVHRGENMFVATDVPLGDVTAGARLRLVCRALGPLLRARHPRPSWRTRLVATQNLRFFRTALLGRLRSDGATPAPVGPWRGIALGPGAVPRLEVRPHVDGATATVEIAADLGTEARSAQVVLGGRTIPLDVRGSTATGSADVSALERWWPHGYGTASLHDAVLTVDGDPVASARVGLREIGRARVDAEGLSLSCNGTPLFVRGAVWSPIDPVSLQNEPHRLAAVLDAFVTAGLNTVRVPGVIGYEDEAFYAACDERGLLVWQDLAMANLDPPAVDVAWRASLDAELSQLGRRLAGHPCVAVVCGGSETEQQAVMTGIDDYSGSLGLLLAELRTAAPVTFPGTVWVDNSPTGGERPFSATPGATHWFGVGAYLRPLEDVDGAEVGFASECLAFSVPPEPAAIRRFGGAEAAGHHPEWKAGVPRDAGAPWDFEDVTHHYVRTLFGRDPVLERWSDPEYALDLSRAAAVETMTRTMTAWRSPRSRCAGALILSAHDLRSGAGWGLLDVDDRPKAPLQALADTCAPTAVLVEDRGLDGVLLHVVHDGPAPRRGRISVRVHDLDGVLVADESADVGVPAAGWVSLDAEAVLGGFRDLNHTHAFGPPRFDVLQARFVVEDELVAEATHLLLGPTRPRVADVGLAATVAPDEDGYRVEVTTRDTAQRVAFDVPGLVPDVGWFHLPPGGARTVRLRPAGGSEPTRGTGPLGSVRALNSRRSVSLS